MPEPPKDAPDCPEDTAEQVAQRLAVQYAVSRVLAESDTTEEAMPRLLQAIGQHLGWRFGAFWIVDEIGGVLRPSSVWQTPAHAATAFEEITLRSRFVPGVGIPGRVWDSGKPVWLADVLADPNFPRLPVARREGLHAAFAFPVHAGGRVLGVLEFFSDRIEPPNQTLLGAAEGVAFAVGQFIERKRAIEAERASEVRRAAILETALDCVVTIDHEGCILEFNPAAEKTFGYRRSEVIGKPMAELIVPPSLRDAHYRGLARYLATGEAHVLGRRIELPAVRADGSELPVELAITRVPLPGPPTFTAYLRDLTDRKRLEARQQLLLEASASLTSSLDLEQTFRNLVRVVVPVLADWCIVDILNPDRSVHRLEVAHQDPAKVAFARELTRRYPIDPEAPHGARHVIRTGESELVSVMSDEVLASVARDETHLTLLRQLGLTSYMAVPLRSRGHMLGAITFMTAESARRYDTADLALAEELARRACQAVENARLYRELSEAHEQVEQQATELEIQAAELEETTGNLKASNEELEGAVAALARRTEEAERARADAEKANRAKAEFLTTMSHELRTPLNAIIGYVQLLELGIRGPVTAQQLEDLRRIGRNSTYLLGLITDILNFATIEAGRVPYALEDVPINEFLAGVEDLIAPLARAQGVRYEYRGGDAAVSAVADREKLLQIMLNLLSNAVTFTPEGGHIVVEWTTTGRNVAIHVRDTGPGIPADKLEAIFEPFVQLGRKYAGHGIGTGLGLAISRELAVAMNGDLTVESKLGDGSTFTLSLRAGPAGSGRASDERLTGAELPT